MRLPFRKRPGAAGEAPEGAEVTPRVRENPPAEFLYEHKWRIFGVMMIGWAMSLLDI
jgi:hypothetical protein